MKVSFSAVQKVVPNASFPKEITPQPANNNLDIIDFEGKLFFVYRTAPTHFASEKAYLYIVSTKDQKKWDFEAAFHLKNDLREPRFFIWKKTLYLYFAELGSDSIKFEPGKMWRVHRESQGKWTKPEAVFSNGFIPWRFRTYKGKPLMVGYDGGENIYKFNGKPLHVYLMTTEDGKNWKPLNKDRPFVLKGGTSETDIAFDKAGNLFAVARNEAGDEKAFGSKICKAPASDITKWTCKDDFKKYDSPLLIEHGGEVYLVGRRHMTKDGNYDLRSKNPVLAQRALEYQSAYWQKPKRCSVWFVNRDTLKVQHLLDLPSKGDTCFPSALPRGEGKFLLYNYSSDIDGPDVYWQKGQNNPTFIYSMFLHFGDK